MDDCCSHSTLHAQAVSGDDPFMSLVAQRQEASLNKAASVAFWAEQEQAAARRLQSAAEGGDGELLGDAGELAHSGRQQLEASDAASLSVSSHKKKRRSPPPRRKRPPPPKRRPPPSPAVVGASPASPVLAQQFEVSTGCFVQTATSYSGGTLPDGYNATALSWPECCILCFQRGDCHAWTYKPGGTGPGCYLKASTGYTMDNQFKGHVSGTMTDQL